MPFQLIPANDARELPDVHYFFPKDEEIEETGNFQRSEMLSFQPNITAPTPIGSVGFSGIGRTQTTSDTRHRLVKRHGAIFRMRVMGQTHVGMTWWVLNIPSALY